jgi:hypothetical protein
MRPAVRHLAATRANAAEAVLADAVVSPATRRVNRLRNITSEV